MNPETARKLVPATMVVTSIAVGVAFFKGKRKAGEGFKTAWALGALFLILSLGVDVTPEIAGPLALMILLGVSLSPNFVLADFLHLKDDAGAGGAGDEGTGGEGNGDGVEPPLPPIYRGPPAQA